MRTAQAVVLALMLSSVASVRSSSAATQGTVSPAVASWLSVLGTLVPVGVGAGVNLSEVGGGDLRGTGGAIIGVGIVAGPSWGHFYGRSPGRALTGIALRSAGLGLYLLVDDEDVVENRELADVLGTFAMVGFLGSAIYDVTTAGRTARQYNERSNPHHEARFSTQIALARTKARLGVRVQF